MDRQVVRVLEDEEGAKEILDEYLEGFVVLAAANGGDALARRDEVDDDRCTILTEPLDL